MAVEEAPRLGCGRSIDRIWATIDQPPNPHEEHCEQCQTARTRLKTLQNATRSLRENDLHNAELKPRPSVKNSVMDVARAEVRRSRRILLHSNDNSTTEISEQALSSVIRFAATAIPGLHARRCHIEIHSGTPSPAPPSGDTVTADTGPHLWINLRVAAASQTDIPRTVDALRTRINTAITACVGISVGTINITVEDLYDV